VLRRCRVEAIEGTVDVAIAGERILDLGPDLAIEATQELDAGRRIASPAFVQPHLHLDKVGWRRCPTRTAPNIGGGDLACSASKLAAREHADLCDVEIVAFPQEGIVRTPETAELMRAPWRPAPTWSAACPTG
jgi:cytosine deaminase